MSEWVYHSKDTFLLDNLEQTSEWISKIWNKGQWENYFKIVYTYTKFGLELENTYFKWSENKWEQFRKVRNVYKNLNLKDSSFTLNYSDSSWINYSLDIFSYDDFNRLLEWIYQIWNKDKWDNIWKQKYRYNPNSTFNEIYLDVWKDNTWYNYSKRVFEYSRALSTVEYSSKFLPEQKNPIFFDINDDAFIQLNSESEDYGYFEVIDLTGNILLKSHVKLNKGLNIIDFSTRNLPSGSYLINLQTKLTGSVIKFNLVR